MKNDAKLSKGESIEKLYYNISPIPYKGNAYNNGKISEKSSSLIRPI